MLINTFKTRDKWFGLLLCSSCAICSFLCNVSKIIICPFVLFPLTIVLFVFHINVSDYSIGIVKFSRHHFNVKRFLVINPPVTLKPLIKWESWCTNRLYLYCQRISNLSVRNEVMRLCKKCFPNPVCQPSL